jgi:hypothetical protein
MCIVCIHLCSSSITACLSILQKTSSMHQQGCPQVHQQLYCYVPPPPAAAPLAHRSPHASAGCELAAMAAGAPRLPGLAHAAVPAVTAAGAPRHHGLAHAAVPAVMAAGAPDLWGLAQAAVQLIRVADDVPAQCHCIHHNIVICSSQPTIKCLYQPPVCAPRRDRPTSGADLTADSGDGICRMGSLRGRLAPAFSGE